MNDCGEERRRARLRKMLPFAEVTRVEFVERSLSFLVIKTEIVRGYRGKI